MGEGERVTVSVRYRSAVWPGGRALAVVATVEKIGEAWWLVTPDGEPHDFQPFRYGMFGPTRRGR